VSFLVKNFLRGLVIVVPVAVTVWALWSSFVAIDRLLGLRVPGLGFAVALALVVAVGFFASNFFTRRLFGLVERLFARAPVVRILYSSLRDLMEAFVGDRRRFDRPVLLRLTPDGALSAIGFVTRDDLVLAGEQRIAVYLPQSYNFAGQLLLVTRSSIEPLEIESSRALALVVSGGVSGV
jgi:uncharacterized membrane protein